MLKHITFITLSLTIAILLAAFIMGSGVVVAVPWCAHCVEINPEPFRLLDPEGILHGYGRLERSDGRTMTLGIYLGEMPPDTCDSCRQPAQCLDTPYTVEFSIQDKRGQWATVRDIAETNSDGAGHIFLIMRIPKRTSKYAPCRVTAVPSDGIPLSAEPFTVSRSKK